MILLPTIEPENEFYVSQLEQKRTLHIICSIPSTVKELKSRIAGITIIPCERIGLLFCGAVLNDQDTLSPEVYSTDFPTGSEKTKLFIEDQLAIYSDPEVC